MRTAPVFFTIFISIILVSCGYRPGVGPVRGGYRTISIPYVCGDKDGMFTAELVRQLAASGVYCYADCRADLLLKVSLNERCDESIGFRYETNQEGEVGRRLVASEDRAILAAEIELVESKTCKVLLGPICLKAREDYDFQPETGAETFGLPAHPQTLTRFSMGQLDLREAAADAVRVPLYRRLAKEIVDYITESW